jgi:predicted dinucleotide-binding enzyme
MRVGVPGSGLMGGKLGTLFARAGHEVTFSYARSRAKLESLAREAGARARAGTPGEAAQQADALLFAVHWSRVNDVLSQAGDLSGKVILSCSLPMNVGDTELVIGHTWSGAEELARMVPAARIVSAFNTVPSEVLFGVFEARREGARPSLVYCGDEVASKDLAAELIRDVGFEPVDAGPLTIARYTEPFALLVARLAYERPGGPELAYRFELLRSHVGVRQVGQFLCDCRVGRRRADRTAVCGDDAACRETTAPRGGGRRRLRDADDCSFQRCVAVIGAAARSLADDGDRRGCDRRTGTGRRSICGGGSAAYAEADRIPAAVRGLAMSFCAAVRSVRGHRLFRAECGFLHARGAVWSGERGAAVAVHGNSQCMGCSHVSRDGRKAGYEHARK